MWSESRERRGGGEEKMESWSWTSGWLLEILHVAVESIAAAAVRDHTFSYYCVENSNKNFT